MTPFLVWAARGGLGSGLHLFAFLGSWTANKEVSKTAGRLERGIKEERKVSGTG